jgi:ubiquinone/menaquinone biosynthesis C-methylase UbiE
MAARSVLDVGCGTGALLHRARQAGHRGRFCGLDPGAGMLERARRRPDVEWMLGDLSTPRWDREFDLVVMSGHAFQVFVSDEEVRTSLAAMRCAVTDGGLVAFETRNPLVREWESWTAAPAVEITDGEGTVVRMAHIVDTPVEGDLVRFTSVFSSRRWDAERLSRSTLRFLDAASLARFLNGAGLVIEEQFGDWDRQPLTETSPEIITIARRG